MCEVFAPQKKSVSFQLVFFFIIFILYKFQKKFKKSEFLCK